MKFLPPTNASKYLWEEYGIKLSPKALANRRHLGLAPHFVRLARHWPRYTEEWLDDYAELPTTEKINAVTKSSAATALAGSSTRTPEAINVAFAAKAKRKPGLVPG